MSLPFNLGDPVEKEHYINKLYVLALHVGLSAEIYATCSWGPAQAERAQDHLGQEVQGVVSTA